MRLAAGQTLQGSGTFVGGLITDASSTLALGLSPGILTVNGALAMYTGSVFSVELSGTTAGSQYDQLNMNGNSLSLLSPTLLVNLGFTPALSDSFQIVTGLNSFDPLWNGTFDGLPDGATFNVGSTTFQIDYNDNNITLTVVPEPGTAGLLATAVVALLLRRQRASHG